jgi:hypothetical protein
MDLRFNIASSTDVRYSKTIRMNPVSYDVEIGHRLIDRYRRYSGRQGLPPGNNIHDNNQSRVKEQSKQDRLTKKHAGKFGSTLSHLIWA